MAGIIENESFLVASNLSVGYSHKGVLLKNLSLSLPGGELVCFMGPNGIGKSTLIRTLAGLQQPLGGEVVYKNKDGSRVSHKDLQRIPKKVAVVLTDRISTANLTVYDLVTYGRYPYLTWNLQLSDTDTEAVDQSIARLRLDHLKEKKIYELSDGQMQMVMIARALAQNSDIILLDEPTAHLDLNNRVEIMSLLRKIARESAKAILVSTHELDLALQTADRIWLAGSDQNILTGIPEDLVLDGSFDSIFQFKGFDLKTGKVIHEVYREQRVNINGGGHEYLWTRNALERNGYRITTHDYQYEIEVHSSPKELHWTVSTTEDTHRAESLNHLLQILSSENILPK